MKALSSKPALWSLFLFNALVALVLGLVLDGTEIAGFVLEHNQRIGASVGMGVVALGAGLGLVRAYRKPAVGRHTRADEKVLAR